MSVYELDIKGMRKTFQKFNKTLYGKTVFLLAYIVPLFTFLVAIATIIVGFIQDCPIIKGRAATLFVVFAVTFILGNVYFYSEIRKYCEYEDHKKK